MKMLKEEFPSGIESSDGVKSRSRVHSDHQNVEHIISSSSLFQCLVTATFDVRFQSCHGVEVGVEGLISASGVALNSYKVSVSDFDVCGKPNCFSVPWFIVIISYHLRTVFNEKLLLSDCVIIQTAVLHSGYSYMYVWAANACYRWNVCFRCSLMYDTRLWKQLSLLTTAGYANV